MNLNLNKDKCHFRCTSVPFFSEVISRYGVQPNPWKLKALTDMLPLKTKKELQTLLSIINYFGKLSPSTVTLEACKSLRKLMSVKTEWTWNATYQKMFDKTKAIIKEDAYMKFYDETQPLHIKTDASWVGLGAALLQTRRNTNYHRNKASLGLLHSPVKASLGQKKYTAILKKKH